MRIGILELKRDEFITEVVKRLKGHKVSYIQLKEWTVPLSSKYRVVIDRMSYDNTLLREMLKNYSLDGTYVINNPFSASLSNKIVDSKICSSLDIPVPETRVFPIIDEELKKTIAEPNWEKLKEKISFPVVFKPYDGYGWTDVYIVGSMGELKNLYNAFKDENIMLVQKFVSATVYRAFCINKKDVMIKKWNPPQDTDLSEISSAVKKIKKWTVKLNKALDFDLNSTEWSIDEKGKPFMVDAFNDVPLITRRELNEEQFNWIVEKFTECIKEKATSNAKNKVIFKAK